MAQVLSSRDDIRQWVEARGGYPMLMDVPEGTSNRTLLQLTFGQHALNSDNNEGPDRIGGFHLVSWEEWFAALEEGQLALRVSDDPAGGNEAEFEFVSNDGEGETTDAARKPAAIDVQSPTPEDRGF
ncbi:hypothetical protein ACFSX5_08435 [Devosia albogilva]|uniref:Uncharacterized protein n=1 Tax=Devosia albogilva TaxID=429726 RepID=A0ABW5QJ77_9HYPH